MVRRFLAAAAMSALFLSPITSAQLVNATVSGTITDFTGGLLQAVTVTAENVETGVVKTTLSNEAGFYSFPSLQPGTYKITASKSGFFPNTYEYRLGNASYGGISFTLPLASVITTNVELPAMSMDAMMAISSPSPGFVLSEEMVRQLPLLGGDTLDLVRMLPGVNMVGPGAGMSMSSTSSTSPTFSYAGVGQISLNTTRDGVIVSEGRYNNGLFATTRINPDLVGEIRLILTPVDAELGRGNGQVQIQTRSGANRFAGSAVWNIRNSALDANTWSNNRSVDPLTGEWSPTVPDWNNNHQYTVSFGGPIVKNKTFFFVLWDQQINNQRNLVTGAAMTDTARQGIFRYFEGWNPGNVLTPTTGGTNGIIRSVDQAGNPLPPPTNPDGTSPYTGGLRCFSVFGNVKFDGSPFTAADCPGGTALINQTPWDPRRPVADSTGYIRKILDKMPSPNYFGPTGNANWVTDGLNLASYRWVRPGHGSFPTLAGDVFYGVDPYAERKQINVKIDQNFNSSHRLSVAWSHERNEAASVVPSWPGGLSYSTRRSPHVVTASFHSALSPNLMNEARFGLRYQYADMAAPWELNSSREAALGYTLPGSNGYLATVVPGSGNYNLGGSTMGVMNVSGAYIGNKSPLYTYADTLSWTVRNHAIKFGAEVRFDRSNGNVSNPTHPWPKVMGGAGGLTSPLANQIPGLPLLPSTSRTNASNMLYLLAGSVNNASMLYWVDDPGDVADDTWEDFKTEPRRYWDQRRTEWAVFWKDDWKVRHNLTLNLGLRYEFYGSPYLATGSTTTARDQGDGLWGTFRSGGGNPFERWLSPGNVYLTGYGPNVAATDALRCTLPDCDPSTLTTSEFVGPNSPNPGKQFLPADWNNFGPAVGFAWRLPWFGEGKTTVRGGYQITYGGSFGGFNSAPVSAYLANALGTFNNPSTANLSEFSGQYLDLRSVSGLVPMRSTTRPGQQREIFSAFAGASSEIFAYDANYATPYVQNFNLSVSRTLGHNVTVDVRYLGTVSKKQQSRINLNLANVYHNPELFEAIEITRAGGNAPLFDQLLAGLNLNNGVAGYGPVGTVVNGVLQTGSAHLRRNASFAANIANGNFVPVANVLNTNGPTNNMPAVGAPGGFLPLPQGLANVGARLLRNGCDRLASGQVSVGPNNPAPLRCFPENYIRANPQLGNAFLNNNSASSSYHSMQAQIMARPTRGFTAMGTYTWSKNLEIPGLVYTNLQVIEAPDYTDPSDRRGDYTYTLGHYAHDFRGSGTFELPLGPGKPWLGNSSGWLAHLAGGWQTGIILTMISGGRSDISASNGTFATGLYGSSVPDVVGPMPSHLQGSVQWDGDNGSYFDNAFIKVADPQCAGVTTADNNLRGLCSLRAVAIRNADGSAGPIVLQNPKPGTRGTLGQKTIELPGTWSFDANLGKTFRVSESGWIKSIHVRMDATNVLNHPSPGLPDLNINNNSPFGIITTKDGGRAFQGQVRVDF